MLMSWYDLMRALIVATRYVLLEVERLVKSIAYCEPLKSSALKTV